MAPQVFSPAEFRITLVTSYLGQLLVRLHVPLQVLLMESFEANRTDSLQLGHPEGLLGLAYVLRCLPMVTIAAKMLPMVTIAIKDLPMVTIAIKDLPMVTLAAKRLA